MSAAAVASAVAPSLAIHTPAAAEAPANEQGEHAGPPQSIYDLHTPGRKRMVLLTSAMIALITPFADTVYLPALANVAASLKASPDLTAATMSVYMACVGIFSLVWGPLSDKFGRRMPIFVGMLLFIVFSLGCGGAETVEQLIGLRAAQGAAVGSCVAVTQGTIADTFRPRERGTAMGIYHVPLLLGPIIAPAVGGALSQVGTWRATFWLLAALAGAIFFLALSLPETHHWHVIQRRKTTAIASASATPQRPRPLAEEPHTPKPTLHAPWRPLLYLVEPDIAPYVATSCSAFSSMFVLFTYFPTLLASPPYSLSESNIGVSYLPIGIGLWIGSMAGGKLSDMAGSKQPGVPQARLVPSLAWNCLLPVGLLIFALCGAEGLHLGIVLFGTFIVGLGQAAYGPGFMAYLSSMKQANAGGIASAAMALNFAMSGVLISATVPLEAALGIRGYFGLLAGAHMLMILWAGIDMTLRMRRHTAPQQTAKLHGGHVVVTTAVTTAVTTTAVTGVAATSPEAAPATTDGTSTTVTVGSPAPMSSTATTVATAAATTIPVAATATTASATATTAGATATTAAAVRKTENAGATVAAV